MLFIKMDFKERGRKGADWIHLAHKRNCRKVLVNTIKNIRTGKFLSS
jgi:hypothetical protein